MKINWLVFFLLSYIVANSLNFFPSIKFPDVSIDLFDFLGTCLFLIGMTVYILKGVQSWKEMNRLKMYLSIGFLSGFLIYLSHVFEGIGAGSIAGDIIGFIQYPFFLIFTTPLFGGNFIFEMNYAIYAIIASFLYLPFLLWIRVRQL